MFIPNIVDFFKSTFQKYNSILLAELFAYTQEEFNEYYAGPNFFDNLVTRYSYLLFHISLTFVFAPSMPILLLFGLFGLVMQ